MNSVITTRKLPTGSIEATLGGLTVVVRQKDGFINATRLCKDGGKKFNDWYRLDSSNAFLEALRGSAGITADVVDAISTGGTLKSVAGNPVSALIDISKGGDPSQQGTWVHPDVAVQIANWISPTFAVSVSQVVRRYYAGDLTVAAETLENYDAIHGTTSVMKVDTVLGKRKLVLELDEKEAKIRRMNADMLRECMDYLTPREDVPEVERIRAESDLAVLRSHYIKVVTGGETARAITDGRGSEISFALLEQKMGIRQTKAQRMAAGRKMSQLMRQRYGEDHVIPKREEFVDGRVTMVNAYWSCDEDLMRAAIESSRCL